MEGLWCGDPLQSLSHGDVVDVLAVGGQNNPIQSECGIVLFSFSFSHWAGQNISTQY